MSELIGRGDNKALDFLSVFSLVSLGTERSLLVGSCDPFRGRQREARAQGGAGARRRLDVEAAAGEFGSLDHAHQPQTGAQPLDVEANPVIPDRDLEGNVL